jgi:thiol-disulfide isomerase/thioredoxin
MSTKNTKIDDKKTQNTTTKPPETKPAESSNNNNNDNNNNNNNPPDEKENTANPSVTNSASKPKKKLAPIKPKGKAPEDEKKSLKKTNPPPAIGKRNSLKTKKDENIPEKELYTHFGRHIVNYKGEECDLDINTFLKYSVIGILFTGSWCPPAREFLIQLESLYKEINKNEKVFEIIQISSEKTEKNYNENRNENRPWLYLPFNDGYMKNLVEQFKVEFLPTFIIVNRDLFVLSENGRKDMSENEGVKAYEKWYKSYRTRKEAMEKEKEDKEDELNAHEEEEIGD